MEKREEFFESRVDAKEWGERIDPKSRDGYPVIFNFRPKQFVAVSKDRLKDWEEMMKLEVGLIPDRSTRMWSGHPCETISGSNSDWDDSDCW